MSRAAQVHSRGAREREASELLGCDVRNVPKSSLAVVAIYLAMRTANTEDFEGARDQLWREWKLLFEQRIVKAPPPRLRRVA